MGYPEILKRFCIWVTLAWKSLESPAIQYGIYALDMFRINPRNNRVHRTTVTKERPEVQSIPSKNKNVFLWHSVNHIFIFFLIHWASYTLKIHIKVRGWLLG